MIKEPKRVSCTRAPSGSHCSRDDGHDGPCAAAPSMETPGRTAFEAYWGSMGGKRWWPGVSPESHAAWANVERVVQERCALVAEQLAPTPQGEGRDELEIESYKIALGVALACHEIAAAIRGIASAGEERSRK